MRSAGMIIVRKEKEEYLFLMLRSYNYWDFPKGRIEANENVIQAARREVKEETGLLNLHFDWGNDYYETEVYGIESKRKTACFFLARTENAEIVMGINEELGKPEHEEFQWLTFEEAYKRSVPRIKKALKWANKKIKEWPRNGLYKRYSSKSK